MAFRRILHLRPNPSNDPAWRNRSVGLVLVGGMIRDAIASGLTDYDILRGMETSKPNWTGLLLDRA